MKEFNLDIVYVIDATNGGAIIDKVKDQIAEFVEKLLAFNKGLYYPYPVEKVREKLVFFGDFATEGDKAIIETEFYDAATKKAEFLSQLDRDDIRMSGVELTNAMEALFTAMNSDWFKIDWSKDIYGRHIIVLVSDKYPLNLQESKGTWGYDGEKYPSDIMEFQDIWDMAGSPDLKIPISEFKRLNMFVPDGNDGRGHSWEDIMCMENVCCDVIDTSRSDKGIDLCREIFLQEIFREHCGKIYQHRPPLTPRPKAKFEGYKPVKIEKSKRTEFNFDIVYVIDSLICGAIDNVKDVIAEFGDRLKAYSEEHYDCPHNVREKLVFFGDFAYSLDPIIETEFYDAATQKAEFLAQLDRRDVRMGGNSRDANGLEALYTAMNSDWTRKIDPHNEIHGRQIIVLISDRYPLKLQERKGSFGYDGEKYPSDMQQMTEIWGSVGSPESKLSLSPYKRLILFVPDGDDGAGHDWQGVAEWGNTCFSAIDAYGECSDMVVDEEAIFLEIIRDTGIPYWSYKKHAADTPTKPVVEPKTDKKPEKIETDLNQCKKFVVDIALVVDSTGSMGPCIDMLKNRAATLDEEIVELLAKVGKKVDKVRIRVIDFADFATECDEAIRQTDFFTMPQEKDKLIKALGDIDCTCRGGDLPENGLEALYCAMNSDWTQLKNGVGGRHIIILLTDAPPLRLLERSGCVGYWEDDFPPTIEDLQSAWDNPEAYLPISKRNKRLILIAPSGDDGNGHSWDNVTEWEHTLYFDVRQGNGLDDVDLIDILKKCM